MRGYSFLNGCLTVGEAVFVGLSTVSLLLAVLYTFPVLIVKEDVRVVYRYYAPDGYLVEGLNSDTLRTCPNGVPLRTYKKSKLFLFGNDAPQDETKGKYVLWTLVHPIDDKKEICSRFHWHVAGEVMDEETAQHWTQQEYSDGCGTFVAHTMTVSTYLWEKVTDCERGPIVGTLLDFFL